MYCNKCGKELPAESLFCPYCGEKQEAIASPHGNDNAIVTEQIIEEQSIQTSDRTKANAIANEIVANLKMIGLAILLSALYIGVFWICHIKDRKPVQENYYGYSCYDNPYMYCGELDWNKIYSELIIKKSEQEKKYQEKESQFKREVYPLYKDDPIELERVKKLYLSDSFNKYSYLVNASNEDLIKKAKETATHNKEVLNSEINENRQLSAKDSFYKNLKYSVFISLALTIFGRYLIKGIKWVAKNR